MALPVPAFDPEVTGKLRYYTDAEKALIDLKRRGVSNEGDHIKDEMGPDGAGSTRRYSCAWDQRYAAAFMLTGYASSYQDGDGKVRISRLLPDQHPNGSRFNWFCTKVAIDPYCYLGVIDPADFGQSVPRFKRAELTATYELLPFSLAEDDSLTADQEYLRYVVKPGLPGAEISTESNYIPMAGGSQNFTTLDGTTEPAGVPIPYGIGYTENTSKFKIIFRRVPQDLWGPGTTLHDRVKGDGTPGNRGYIGSLNLTTFFDMPPLTAKLEGVEEKQLPDNSGLGYAWDIEYRFLRKNVPYGHLGFLYLASTSGGTFNGYYQALAGQRRHAPRRDPRRDRRPPDALHHPRARQPVHRGNGAVSHGFLVT